MPAEGCALPSSQVPSGKPKRTLDKVEAGNVYGRLTAVSKASDQRDARGTIRRMWNCICSCGKHRVVRYAGHAPGLFFAGARLYVQANQLRSAK